MMKLTYGHGWLLTLLAATLLAACSDDTPDTSAEAQEIRFRADVWHVMEGTRATTYNNATDMQTEGSFACTTYYANTTSEYISPVAVNWNTDRWEFSDGSHKWPDTGDALDFFAYMPSTRPSYISSDPTYTVLDSNSDGTLDTPQASFSCTVPSDQSTLKEFVLALITNQTQAAQGRTGVALTFTHPFACVRFVLSPASGTHVTINSVTISDVKSTGTCTFDGTTTTWSGQSSPEAFGGSIGTNYIAVPQTFAGSSQTINVTAQWDEWTSGVSKTLSTNVTMAQWEAGKSYTYTLTLKENALIVDTNKYTEQW